MSEIAVIRCPNCLGETTARCHEISCISCNNSARLEERTLDWRQRLQETSRWNLQTVLGLVDPFRSPLSPIVLLTKKAVEGYYSRCQRDIALAEKFAAFYLPSSMPHTGLDILDYGCGRGRITALMSQLGNRLYIYDTVANASWEDLDVVAGQVTSPESEFQPWANNAFDLIFCFMVLTYVPLEQMDQVFDEFYRMLRPGGVCVIEETNPFAPSAAKEAKRFRRNLHSLDALKTRAAHAGLVSRSDWYEEPAHSPFPRLQYFLRRVLAQSFDYETYGHKSDKLPTERHNRKYILILQRPTQVAT